MPRRWSVGSPAAAPAIVRVVTVPRFEGYTDPKSEGITAFEHCPRPREFKMYDRC